MGSPWIYNLDSFNLIDNFTAKFTDYTFTYNFDYSENIKYFPKYDEYADYIENHVINVGKAFNDYGYKISDILHINYNLLRYNIENHDISKMDIDEFIGYRNYFYPMDGEIKNKEKFDKAWFMHIKKNPHHPEYWTYVDDNHKAIIMDMEDIYIAEMILDWASFNYNENKSNIKDFWEEAKYKKPLSDNTKRKVDNIIKQVF